MQLNNIPQYHYHLGKTKLLFSTPINTIIISSKTKKSSQLSSRKKAKKKSLFFRLVHCPTRLKHKAK